MVAGPQTCKRCGRVQYVVWHVSDRIWERFCRKTGWDPNKTICLECFAELCGDVDLGLIPDRKVHFYDENLWEEVIRESGISLCERCGRVLRVFRHMSGEIWKEFCGKTGWDPNRTICLECFAELCESVGLDLFGRK